MSVLDIQQQIEATTTQMCALIQGQHCAVAMGAALNTVMTIAQNTDSPALRGRMSQSFRNIADQLDAMNGPKS